MACCLTAPSHYPNQCWLTIICVMWHLHERNFIGYIPRVMYTIHVLLQLDFNRLNPHIIQGGSSENCANYTSVPLKQLRVYSWDVMEIQTTTEKGKPSFDKICAQSSTSTSREEDSGSSTKGTFRTSWYILYSTGYLSLVNISYVFLAKDTRNSYKWRILNDEAYWVEVIHVYSHKRPLVGWSCPFAKFIRWACGLVWITCGGGNECGRAWADWGMTKPETVCCLTQTDINSHDSRKEWWLGEGLWWLQCFSSGVTTVLRRAIDMVLLISDYEATTLPTTTAAATKTIIYHMHHVWTCLQIIRTIISLYAISITPVLAWLFV